MSLEKFDEFAHWYAIHTKPKQERRAESNLRAWDIETFTPKIKDRRRIRTLRGSNYIIKPLFPQYIFAHFNLQSYLHKVTFARGVHSIVRFGDDPARIDDEIISIIQLRLGDEGFVRMGDELKCGDSVIIRDGPFQSLIGIFEGEVGEADRIRILLTAISYQAHITIEKDRVTKAPPVCGENRIDQRVLQTGGGNSWR